jgi:beta-galactosidase GanA
VKVNAHIAAVAATAAALAGAVLAAPASADTSPHASTGTTSNQAALGDVSPSAVETADTRPTFGDGRSHTITYDRYSLKIDGKRQYIWSGEFHPFRLPSPDLWRDVLEKYKANGFNTVSFYFDWAQHSPKQGVYDFSGIRDVDRLLGIAEDVGLYVIARPGPYINAEVDSGGYPGWLQTQAGKARTDADDYQAAWEEYFDHINPIIARHQLVDGGGSVILYQIENEYTGTNATGQTYMEELKSSVRADGITVPLFHNDKGRELRWACGKGAPDLYATDTYPGTSVTDYEFLRDGTSFDPDRCGVGDRPFFWAEFQGGWFQPWGGGLYEDNRDTYGPDFERITYGNNIDNHFTMQNLYMLYGGTNIGWTGDPNVVYTSYDYHAAFSEPREQTNKVPVVRQQGYMIDAVKDLRALDNLPGQPAHSNAAIHVDADRNPETGARFFFLRHENIKSTAADSTNLTIDGPDGTYTVPQQAGTGISVNGKDYKILVSGYDMGGQHLVYSTSEIYTHKRIGGRDVAILHNRSGEAGETVLRYASKPTVRVLSGDVTTTWDADRGDLRLNYTAHGLARVRITGGGRTALDLLLADSATASSFWKADTDQGPVLVRGGSLLRSAAQDGVTLKLQGDSDEPGQVEVFASPQVRNISWNGRLARTAQPTASGSQVITVAGPQPVSLPALTSWKHTMDQPEAAPAFDDSGWTVADHTTTNNPTKPTTLPVLYTDDYGFHYGDVWYRGHFTGSGDETGIKLRAGTGKAGAWAVWLNGTYLTTVRTSPSVEQSQAEVAFPAGLVKPGADNVVSVVVRNMGHNEDGGNNDGHKSPRGLLSSTMIGAGTVPTWRIQGARGGEDVFDAVRGPLNNGGLHGERAGYPLPGYPTSGWETVTTPEARTTPGLQWYTTDATLHLPQDQDVPVGLHFGGDYTAKYRALVFVNGWNLGQYVNDVGPQRTFYLPQGILHHQGANRISLAVWSDDGAGPGPVSLTTYGNHLTSLRVGNVDSPGYDPQKYAETATPQLSLTAPSQVADGQTVGATARLAVPAGQAAVSDVAYTLTAPAGWTVGPERRDGDTAVWQVTAPATGRTSTTPPAILRATASYLQDGASHEARTAWAVGRPVPPAPGPEPGRHFVSDLPFTTVANGWGPVEKDMSNGGQAAGDGAVITVGGKEYAKGLGAHAASTVTVPLNGCARFTATVGLDGEDSGGQVAFSVRNDRGDVLWTSGTVTGRTTATADVDVTGVSKLTLLIDPLGSNGHDHSDWADAAVTGCAS